MVCEHDGLQEAAELIIKLDNDDEAYMRMLREPWLPQNRIDPTVHQIDDETVMARG